MNCEQALGLLSPLLDDQLDAVEEQLLLAHLDTCPRCAAQHAALSRTVEVLRELPAVPPPSRFHASLRRRLAAERSAGAVIPLTAAVSLGERIRRIGQGRLRTAGLRRWLAPAAAAAALVVAIGVAGVVPPPNPIAQQERDSIVADSSASGEKGAVTSGPAVTGVAAPTGIELNNYRNTTGGGDRETVITAGNTLIVLGKDERAIIRNGQLALRVTSVTETSQRAVEWTEASGGYVESQVTERLADGTPVATVVLRIPSEQFLATYERMKTLGEFLGGRIESTDVTAQKIDVSARIDSLTVQETQLRNLYAKAQTVDEMLRIENELARVRAEIDSLKNQLSFLLQSSAYSSLTLTLREAPSVGTPSLGQQIAIAFRNSLRWLSYLGARAAVGAASVAPLAGIGLAGFLGVRLVRRGRRRRLSGKDQPPAER